jgi:hypothetical protein
MKMSRFLGFLGCVVACASSRPAGVSEPARALPPAAASPQVAGDDARLLVGSWAEYWAVRGGADTQRYEFFEDGRFAWLASAQAAASTSIAKTGTYALERDGARSLLVLRVAVERFAPCDERCAQHAEGPHTVEHATPLVERYEIGECAPNVEAEALDGHYACRAIDGRAFWRNPERSAAQPLAAQ